MTRIPRALAACFASLLCLGPVGAAAATGSGPMLETDQVTLHLVAAAPDAEGKVRGALIVDLEPGWKTYWIDPGDAGIPPSIDFSATGAATADLSFPAPHRFGDEYGSSNGYTEPMAIAFTLDGLDPGVPVQASVMLGICETICIPVAAELSATPSALDARAEALVDSAFAALPKVGGDRIASAMLHPGTETISVEAEVGAEPSEADLFVSGPEGWYFGAPTISRRTGGTAVFAVPILDRPRDAAGAPASIDVILTAGDQAFERKGVEVGTGR